MGKYIIRRLLESIPVLLGITLVAFLVVRLIPGDVVMTLLRENQDPAQAAEIRRQLGIDRPMWLQLVDWLWRVVRLDFGNAFVSGRPILPDVLLRLPATLELAMAATLISTVVALPLGTLAATHRGKPVDFVSQVLSLIGLSMPNFWLALLLIMLVSLKGRLLPSGGFVSFAEDPLGNLRYLILPAVTLGVAMAAVVSRYTRSSLLDVLDRDYIRSARGKGLPEKLILVRHAMPNALIPVLTIIGIQFGTLLGGTVIVEEIFAWPGIGRFTLQAIWERDYPVVQTMVIVMATFIVLINLLVDVAYSLLDPRIRVQ